MVTSQSRRHLALQLASQELVSLEALRVRGGYATLEDLLQRMWDLYRWECVELRLPEDSAVAGVGSL